MSKCETVRIYIAFPAANRMYECLFYAASSFSEQLKRLYELIRDDLGEEYVPDENSLIYEKNSGILCDPHVSLSSLNTEDGMIFQIF